MHVLSPLLVLVATVSAASAATKEYAACAPERAQQYFSALSNDITSCQKTSTYDLSSGTFPTTTQRDAVCKCTSLIKQLPNIRVPRCKITLDGNAYKFKDAIESVFANCDNVKVLEEPLPASQAGSSDKEETGAEATLPTATTTKPPASKNTTSAPSGSQNGQEDASAGSIDELPTTTPTPTKANKTTKAPAASAVPTPKPTSGATVTSVLSASVAAIVAVAAFLA